MEAQTNAAIIELYKTLLEQQYDKFNMILTALGIFTILLIACTWLVNFVLHNRKIRNEVRSLLEEEEKNIQEIFKTEKKQMLESIKGEIQKEIREEQKEFKYDMTMLSADVARFAAFACEDENSHYNACCWWNTSLTKNIEIKQGKMMRVTAECMEENLAKMKKEDWQQIMDTYGYNKITEFRDTAQLLPGTLHDEKTKILKHLQKPLVDYKDK